MTVPPVVDADAHRPGIQGAVDLWTVITSEGAQLLFAPTAGIARRHAIWHLTAAGNPSPIVHAVQLATVEQVSDFIESAATLLGINPGPIPVEMLPDAANQLGESRLGTYRVLTERNPTDTTPLNIDPSVPERRRWRYFDVPLAFHILRGLGALFVWVVVVMSVPVVSRLLVSWEEPVLWALDAASGGAVFDGGDGLWLLRAVVVGGVSFLWIVVMAAASGPFLDAALSGSRDDGSRWVRWFGDTRRGRRELDRQDQPLRTRWRRTPVGDVAETRRLRHL